MSMPQGIASGARHVLVKWVRRLGLSPSPDHSEQTLEAYMIKHASDDQWRAMLRELRAEYADQIPPAAQAAPIQE